jgi:hypothetical protein
MGGGGFLDDLKHIVVDVIVLYGDLTQENVASKLITFGTNGVGVFWGVITSVIVQLKYQIAYFMTSVHYMSHRTNLVAKTFYKWALWGKLRMF